MAEPASSIPIMRMAAISAKRARRWRCNSDRSARAERSFGTFLLLYVVNLPGAQRGRHQVREVLRGE
jgi:hypothetical protein